MNLCRAAIAVCAALVIWGSAVPVWGATFTVNSNLDGGDAHPDAVCDTQYDPSQTPVVPRSGHCTLRAAIDSANHTAAADVIAIRNVGEIQPTRALPPLTHPVTIRPAGTSRIVLNGFRAGANASGLTIDGGNSTIQSLVIMRFTGHGIQIRGNGGSKVENCYIGTDLTATSTGVSNGMAGVYIQGSGNNTIGGTGSNDGNVLSGNRWGVRITGSTAGGNKLYNNKIGTDRTGNNALPNSTTGVFIQDASDNHIGGTATGQRNWISGNASEGILITGTSSTGNTIRGNHIGVKLDGMTALPNAHHGILIFNASNTVIGGTLSAARNVISGNGESGVRINGPSVRNTVVQGNYIGVRADGNQGLGNTGHGVLISDGQANRIGGTVIRAKNVISSNGAAGVQIQGAAATGNFIQGNYIGTDRDGDADLGNAGDGIFISNAPNTTIGAAGLHARNVISGNTGDGIQISGATATGTKIINNYIGTNALGTLAVANSDNGILITEAPNTTIGGAVPAIGEEGEGNLISGNGKDGIQIARAGATGNKVYGNIVGPKKDGMTHLGNGRIGVHVSRAENNEVGKAGTAATPTTPAQVYGNLISGSTEEGVTLTGPAAKQNKVQGNYIGTNKAGTQRPSGSPAFPQGQKIGVFLSRAPDNTVGGTTKAERNIIGGNVQGVVFNGEEAKGNKLYGNYIGVGPDGVTQVGNHAEAVLISEAPDNLIGGPVANKGEPPGNIISGNQLNSAMSAPFGVSWGGAVHIQHEKAKNNKVRGNLIGTQKDGRTALPNRSAGVYIVGDASDNWIGGDNADDGNVIAFNRRSGVVVKAGENNRILTNSIFENEGLGIDLGADGVTPPRMHASILGPNLWRNPPVIITSGAAGGRGELYGKRRETHKVQVFHSPLADPSGHGEGKTYFHTDTVMTDIRGYAKFSFPAPPAAGGVVTATVTDKDGSTSEFSCGTVTKVPLGGSVTINGTECLRVYVPTRFGGKLTVSTSSGNIEELADSEGQTFTNATDTGEGSRKFGWYTFKVTGAGAHTVSTTFEQSGTASAVPWNFWFFPFLDDPGDTNLFDVPGAMSKYDARFTGAGALAWENANHKQAGALSWEGHCWGGAVASIVLRQPAPAHGFTQEELEGLAGEYFNPVTAPTFLFGLPQEKPTAANTNPVDKHVHKFHTGLRKMLRTQKRSVLIDLRQDDGVHDPAGPIWNQGCYTYTAVMKEDPAAAGDDINEKPRQVLVTTKFVCNDDFEPSTADPASDPNSRREQESQYLLIYGARDGEVMANGALAGRKQNWITMTLVHGGAAGTALFVPSSMFDVKPAGATHWADTDTGTNPKITGARIKALGLTKNPGF